MRKRTINLEVNLPYSKIDWLAKLLFHICSEGDIKSMDVSGQEIGNVIVSLRKEHIEAIANEAITYHDLEEKVLKMIRES